MWYRVSPFSRVRTSGSPSFLRIVALSSARTEWSCQPIAFMISATLAPLRPRSRRIATLTRVSLVDAEATLDLFVGTLAERGECLVLVVLVAIWPSCLSNPAELPGLRGQARALAPGGGACLVHAGDTWSRVG